MQRRNLRQIFCIALVAGFVIILAVLAVLLYVDRMVMQQHRFDQIVQAMERGELTVGSDFRSSDVIDSKSRFAITLRPTSMDVYDIVVYSYKSETLTLYWYNDKMFAANYGTSEQRRNPPS